MPWISGNMEQQQQQHQVKEEHADSTTASLTTNDQPTDLRCPKGKTEVKLNLDFLLIWKLLSTSVFGLQVARHRVFQRVTEIEISKDGSQTTFYEIHKK